MFMLLSVCEIGLNSSGVISKLYIVVEQDPLSTSAV